MIWIRYNTKTGILTGWSDTDDMPVRADEAVIQLNIAKPDSDDYENFLYSNGLLIDNPAKHLPPDKIRLAEILATSPQAITMPEIWEAIRIIAKLL